MGSAETRRPRDFGGDDARPRVRAFYRKNHERQTLDFVRAKRDEYLPLRHGRMGVFEAFERLEAIVDESDPDLELGQLDHALQTAEALRAAGEARWLVLTGLLHDVGKVLCLFGEPQWAVVGDTFPVGCAFSDAVVHADLFAANPDLRSAERTGRDGIYQAGCGLDALLLSWGHDEYGYHVLRGHLPEPALWIVRYHSFYACHAESAYTHLLAPEDEDKLAWVRRFSRYDLYSKSERRPDFEALRPYYQDLCAEFLPDSLCW